MKEPCGYCLGQGHLVKEHTPKIVYVKCPECKGKRYKNPVGVV